MKWEVWGSRLETGAPGIFVGLSVARTCPRTITHSGFYFAVWPFWQHQVQINTHSRMTWAFSFPCRCEVGHSAPLHTSLGSHKDLNQVQPWLLPGSFLVWRLLSRSWGYEGRVRKQMPFLHYFPSHSPFLYGEEKTLAVGEWEFSSWLFARL